MCRGSIEKHKAGLSCPISCPFCLPAGALWPAAGEYLAQMCLDEIFQWLKDLPKLGLGVTCRLLSCCCCCSAPRWSQWTWTSLWCFIPLGSPLLFFLTVDGPKRKGSSWPCSTSSLSPKVSLRGQKKEEFGGSQALNQPGDGSWESRIQWLPSHILEFQENNPNPAELIKDPHHSSMFLCPQPTLHCFCATLCP